MKRFSIVAVLFFAAIQLFAIGPNDLNRLSVTNGLSSGASIDYIFFSATDSSYWGPDILRKDLALGMNQRLDFKVLYPDKSATLDFLAIDSNGFVYEIDNVAFNDGTPSALSFQDSDRNGKTASDLGLIEVVLKNATTKRFEHLFAAPEDSRVWGIELRGSGTGAVLDAGGQTSFLMLLAGVAYKLDVLAADRNGVEFQSQVSIGAGEDTVYATLR